MNSIEKSRLEEMKRLHSEILNSLKMSLEKGFRIGELLAEQKEILKHGEFTRWVNDNLPFTDRTARNYMRLFQERDRLKTENVSGLKDAYSLLVEHKKDTVMMLEEIIQVLTEEKNDDSLWEKNSRLIAALNPHITEGISGITDIEEAVKVHRLAQKVSELCAERTLVVEIKLGKCLNELAALGVPDSVWLTPGGMEKFIAECEAQIAKLEANEGKL